MWIREMVETTCANDPDPMARHLSQEVFIAQTELLRVRRARGQLLSRVLKDPSYRSKSEQKFAAILADVESEIGPIQIPELLKPLFEKPAPQQRYSIALKDFAYQLERMERYESRALSKRRKATGRYVNYVHSRNLK